MASLPTNEEQSGGTSITIQRLYDEIVADDDLDRTNADSTQRADAIVTSILDEGFLDSSFRFDEDVVKENLSELLVLLIALRDGETHGKGLMGDLARLFDARLSPGTLYPKLHDLEEDGVLEKQELVRTKEYRVDDVDESRRRIEAAMRQHLALGLFFELALQEL